MDSSREQDQENILEMVPVLVWANLRTREEWWRQRGEKAMLDGKQTAAQEWKWEQIWQFYVRQS